MGTNYWEKMTIQEAGVLLIDCVHKTPTGRPFGYPYIAIPQIKDGRIDTSDARLISYEDFINWTQKAKPQIHDVVLSRRCNPGHTAVITEELNCAIGQNLVLLRSQGDFVYPPFLRWLVRGPEWWNQIMKFLNAGAVFDSLKCADIPNFKLTIPPLPEQRAIADVLSALDDKIDLNRRMNRTLESLAHALFKHMFLDNPDDNWEEKPIDEIATFLNGLALQKYPPKGEEYLPVIKIAQLRTNSSEGADKAGTYLEPRYIVNDGDVLFSWSGSLTVILWCGGKGALNQHLFKVTSDWYPKWFYYYWIKHHLPEFQVIAEGKATTMGHIQRHHLHEAMVLLPDENTLDKLTLTIEPLIDKIIANNIESQTLAVLRDNLLPRLLNGQIRVTEKEK